MPRRSDAIPIKNPVLDRRVKLLPEQKNEIRKRWALHEYNATHHLIGEALSQRILAKQYGVSRRTIIFILYPERLKENLRVRNARGGSKAYYDKLKPGEWAKTMREHRNYKKGLYQKGLIGT